jgi:uncharacterized protein (TIGR03435 family)
MIDFIGNHLWQSTLCAAAMALLTLLFRKNHARVRYWLWLAASIKFLIPFSLFIAIGSSFDFRWQESASIPPSTIYYVENISQPFGPITASPSISGTLKPDRPHLIPVVLYAIWICGFVAVLLLYVTRGRRLKNAKRRAQPLTNGSAYRVLRAFETGLKKRIRLVSSTSFLEPGVCGIFRPVLLLPEGITERLNDSELEAIIAHEVVHVRRHDNLIATVHMVVEALFWFHPMVWWLGAKLVQERERACDEEVLKLVRNPQSYAEGILKVCEFYLESPLACVAGVTGADMKKRIQEIMAHRIGRKLSLGKKLLLVMAGVVALISPVIIGLLNTPSSLAQSQTESKPSFEVTSVKIAENCGGTRAGTNMKIPMGSFYQPGGRYITCSQLQWIIMDAYQLDPASPPTGGPDWMDDMQFHIEAKAEGNPGKDEMRLMVQSLLEERFKLKVHRELRAAPVYFLVTVKGGPKFQSAKDEQGNPVTSRPSEEERRKKFEEMKKGGAVSPGDLAARGGYSISMKSSGHELKGRAMTMGMLADALFSITGRLKVVDKTGLTGLYDLKLVYADPYSRQSTFSAVNPNPAAEFSAPSIFTAIQEQLGLKLVPEEAPREFLVIDSVEKPSEN